MGTSEFRRVYSAGPSITKLEIDYATDAVANGWFDNRNSYLERFTDSFSEYVKIDHVLPTAHCTDAIHLALLALNIGPGDEVIVPDLTWVASGAPILYVGATPVFADVSKETWCISVEDIEKKFTPKTKAVVVVDLLGNMPDWDPILTFCRSKGIAIIEDAAESVGAKYKGRVAGSFGDISLFSFNATKLMMAGQGGAFCTNNKELYTSAKRKSHHGIDTIASGKYFWSNELGYNYNWTNVQAAVALAQLERIEQLLAHKRWVFETYSSLLRDQDSITLNQRTNETFEPSYWVPSIIFDQKFNFSKEEVMKQGAKVGIDFRPMFYPLSSMPTFSAQFKENSNMPEQNPTSYYLSGNGLSLPSGNELVEQDLVHVSEFIRATIRNLED